MKYKYSEKYIKDNINEVLEAVPLSFYANKDWYVDMNKWCKDLAEELDLPIMPVVGVFAALSPQCSVKLNKIFCREYFNSIFKHTKNTILKCHRISSLYGNINENEEERILSILNGEKTKNFFINILYPGANNDAITLDRYMMKICGVIEPTISTKQYKFLAKCYCDVASENNLVPSCLQSILWVYWREQNNKNIFN